MEQPPKTAPPEAPPYVLVLGHADDGVECVPCEAATERDARGEAARLLADMDIREAGWTAVLCAGVRVVATWSRGRWESVDREAPPFVEGPEPLFDRARRVCEESRRLQAATSRTVGGLRAQREHRRGATAAPWDAD